MSERYLFTRRDGTRVVIDSDRAFSPIMSLDALLFAKSGVDRRDDLGWVSLYREVAPVGHVRHDEITTDEGKAK